MLLARFVVPECEITLPQIIGIAYRVLRQSPILAGRCWGLTDLNNLLSHATPFREHLPPPMKKRCADQQGESYDPTSAGSQSQPELDAAAGYLTRHEHRRLAQLLMGFFAMVKSYRFLVYACATVSVLSTASGAAASNSLATWFRSLTCPALDGLYSKKQPPYVKTGVDGLVVNVPTRVLSTLRQSMSVPWYVYDPRTGAALSHIGGDSGVVWTLRAVSGRPPVSIPQVDLSNARTVSGLRLGASAASVVQRLGKPLVIHACGMERYEYSDNNDRHSEQNDLDFTIRNGRVIEIAHTSWG